eukprot:TRINITY_DN1390_c0_g2_i1.p1 TRINITY_DN1390_c0_g2~~TRINITY_DN1390_c0_g2_i1.p1  ORF type:complete len:366 (+),score=64.77 TRINITY_DN1390_c0_g2_i1:34-1131(+)
MRLGSLLGVVSILTLLGYASCDVTIPPSDPAIDYIGRWNLTHPALPVGDWSGVAVRATFQGTTAITVQFGINSNVLVNIILKEVSSSWNESAIIHVALNLTVKSWTSTTPLNSMKSYTITIIKRTEAFTGELSFLGFTLSGPSCTIQPTPPPKRTIEFYGDSITCGYGDLGHYPCAFTIYGEDESVAWGYQVAIALQADVHVEAWSGKGLVRNYGDPVVPSKEPMPSYWGKTLGNSDTTDTWNFAKWSPNAVVINLGTNDYSTKGGPSQEVFVTAYIAFIKRILASYASSSSSPPKIFLACGPMIGDPCCEYVQQAANMTQSTYINLQNILTFPADYGCDYHPAISGHTKMANTAIPIIKKVLGW